MSIIKKKKTLSPLRILLGLFLSSGIGLLAYHRRSLDRSGVVGAMAAGTSTFGFGGWSWGLSLIFFFVSSSLLSHFKERQKTVVANDKFSKGSQRDIGQVLANGGVASALAVTYGLTSQSTLAKTVEAGYLGALATATADTWATELGVLSTQTPRLITNGQLTTPGTSGGITLLGTAAASSGALALGLFYKLIEPRSANSLPVISLVSGLVGSLLDSYLGATVQAMYYCPHCQKETEQHIHSCGTPTQHARGLSWVDNDGVNFLTTLFGSLVAMLLHIPFGGYRKRL